jgi:hypothetical protein
MRPLPPPGSLRQAGLTLARMGTRPLTDPGMAPQVLGLVCRDDGTWRPAGLRQPPAKTGRGTSEEVRQTLALGVWL